MGFSYHTFSFEGKLICTWIRFHSFIRIVVWEEKKIVFSYSSPQSFELARSFKNGFLNHDTIVPFYNFISYWISIRYFCSETKNQIINFISSI